MGWRCEVKLPRTDEWMVFDEHRDTVGERKVGKRQYERWLLQASPILTRREYRIVRTDAPPMKTLFTMTLPL